MFLLTDIGFSLSYPTVLVAALTGLNNKTNPNETLKISGADVSWLGKVNVFFHTIRNGAVKLIFFGQVCH